MSITEELSKLETSDASLSQRLVQSWKRKLNVSREPELLSELIDYQLSTQSKPALRILLGTKDLYSHDFFAKINDCLHRQSTCLQSLRLLSHMLIGQTSWLYKIVHSAAFPTLLKLLRPIHSISIITSSVYLLCALIPLNPYHVTPHLPDIFESFTLLATLNCGGENKVSEEVLLSVRVAVYFLFLQLYSLYPCSFVQYLKGRFGPTGEVHIYQEYIAPLFQYVQLHPNLIVELPSQETQRTKWSSKDPSEIATLSLSLCVDPCLVSKNENYDSISCKNTSTLRGECSSSMLQLPSDQRYCGALSSNELSEMSSPSLVFTQVAPPPSNTPGSQSSRTSLPVLPLATGAQGGAYFDSLSQSPTPPREEERRRTDCTNSLNLQSVSNSAQPFSPPTVHVSCPSVEETVLLASQKLQKIAESQESPQKVPNQDKEGFPLASINNTSTGPQLVARTVLKEKRENVLNGSASILTHSSSPLEALDIFIQTGLVLHKSNSNKSDGLSLSDLEAMDWDHFGCCPHVEELRVLSQLLSSLHSQVLFERYQCQSHAKRNRRLMRHLLLEELYHQQKLSLSTLRRENVHTQQTKELNESLVKEKEGASNSVSVLRREVAKLQMLLKDRETDIKNKEGQIATLKESLWKAQEKYVEKTKSLESKYQCIKNINQELEESLFSFKNRPVHRSRHHKRSESSHLSHSVTPTNTGNVTPTM
ncbi:PREDICTED: hamartin-like [Amphimedon queenslandica]|uniref:Hamartin n=2 Tax=Amphimedon queenslandica TaxID=400682 RepID=A0AAN0JNN7_AMPQE|nr:PREDICTED: hamartin-like [Amphimedon queenslandica]|eukprot:XP_019858430.1 PREDICTED: hamartin-like [Amphimedon queenslandica]